MKQHYVMKGGSPVTAACMLRRSFRNWFRPNYPYVYASFRLSKTNSRGLRAISASSRPTCALALRKPQKELHSKYLYDELGSSLFEAITHLPEYGLTRADERLLAARTRAISRSCFQRPSR